MADIQPLVLGLVLVWAGAWKVGSMEARRLAGRSGLQLMLPSWIRPTTAHASLGLVELGLGLVLLTPPAFRWEVVSASGLAAAFVLYLVFLMVRAPDRPCACLGGALPVSRRTLVRALLLLLVAAFGWRANDFWLQPLLDVHLYQGLIVLEFMLLGALSPELDDVWSRPFRRTRRVAPPDRLSCGSARVPLSETLQTLKRSAAYASASQFLASAVKEHWREGCWRYVAFEARYEGRHATAVFAVPVGVRGRDVRGAIVGATSKEILWQTA